jgi:hypothetical protein
MGFSTLLAAAAVATVAVVTPLAAAELERPTIAAGAQSQAAPQAQSGTQLNGIRINGVRPNGIRVNLNRNGAPASGSAAQTSDPNGTADHGGFQPLTVILPDGRGLIAE